MLPSFCECCVCVWFDFSFFCADSSSFSFKKKKVWKHLSEYFIDLVLLHLYRCVFIVVLPLMPKIWGSSWKRTAWGREHKSEFRRLVCRIGCDSNPVLEFNEVNTVCPTWPKRGTKVLGKLCVFIIYIYIFFFNWGVYMESVCWSQPL